jgi:hypothetical protein
MVVVSSGLVIGYSAEYGARGTADGLASPASENIGAAAGSQEHPGISLVKQYWGTFYYPWYGNSPWRHWNNRGHHPPTTWASQYLPDDGMGRYDPSSELYSSTATNVINRHLAWMDDARFDFALVSWRGQNSYEDSTFSVMLSQAELNSSLSMKLAVYYEPEATSDPTVSGIVSDLTYIYNNRASSSAYFKVPERIRNYPVVFVYGGPADTVDYVTRWSQARDQMYALGKPMFIVLKVFTGFSSYASWVDGWHQYGPATRYELLSGFSAFASPGYWDYPELAASRGHSTATPLLSRNATAFQLAVQTMAGLSLSQAPFLLIETFNEFHEGSQIEPAFLVNHDETGFTQACPSYGFTFLNIVRNRGVLDGSPYLVCPVPTRVPLVLLLLIGGVVGVSVSIVGLNFRERSRAQKAQRQLNQLRHAYGT